MDPPLCPTCGQPASEALGGHEHEWDCRNEACPEFGQPVADSDRARRLAFAIPPIEQARRRVSTPPTTDDRALPARRRASPSSTAARRSTRACTSRCTRSSPSSSADLDPPEAWATAQRLRRLGYRRHEILHMLGAAMTGEIWHALHDQREYDRDAHLAALAALPESWERQRPGGPAPPAHADEAKRRRKAQRTARRANRRR